MDPSKQNYCRQNPQKASSLAIPPKNNNICNIEIRKNQQYLQHSIIGLQEDCVKYLGFTIGSGLEFNSQTKTLESKIARI